jgi:hypothetical protein
MLLIDLVIYSFQILEDLVFLLLKLENLFSNLFSFSSTSLIKLLFKLLNLIDNLFRITHNIIVCVFFQEFLFLGLKYLDLCINIYLLFIILRLFLKPGIQENSEFVLLMDHIN